MDEVIVLVLLFGSWLSMAVFFLYINMKSSGKARVSAWWSMWIVIIVLLVILVKMASEVSEVLSNG